MKNGPGETTAIRERECATGPLMRRLELGSGGVPVDKGGWRNSDGGNQLRLSTVGTPLRAVLL